VGWVLTAFTSTVAMYVIVQALVAQSALVVLFVTAEGTLVECSVGKSQEETNRVQTLFWGVGMLGAFLGTLVGGSLNIALSAKAMFLVNAAPPLMLIPIVIYTGCTGLEDDKDQRRSLLLRPSFSKSIEGLEVEEELDKGDGTVGFCEFLTGLKEAFRKPEMWKPLLFIGIQNVLPSMSSQTNFYYYTTKLHISKATMDIVTNVATLTGLGAYVLYYMCFVKVPVRKMICIGIPIVQLASASQLLLFTGLSERWGIPDSIFLIFDTAFQCIFSTIIILPLLGTVALLCPPGMEATIFCVYTAMIDLSSAVSTQITAGMTTWFGITSTNYDNIAWYCLACRIINLIPLCFLFLLPSESKTVEHQQHRLSLRARSKHSTWAHHSARKDSEVGIAHSKSESRLADLFKGDPPPPPNLQSKSIPRAVSSPDFELGADTWGGMSADIDLIGEPENNAATHEADVEKEDNDALMATMNAYAVPSVSIIIRRGSFAGSLNM